MSKPEKKQSACGCIIERDRYDILSLTYCPMHKAAPKLYEALGAIKRSAEQAGRGYDPKMVLHTIYRLAKEAQIEAEKLDPREEDRSQGK